MAVEKSDDLVALCKRRGFIFQSDEIYGGQKGLYTFGPMGVELKNNLKQAWWKTMVWQRDDVEGLDASLLTSPNILKYSGHEDTFTDPLVDCKDCKSRWREDQLNDQACPSCGSKNLTEPRPFNLMFKTAIGPVDDGSSFVYLRPETAQQIFTNFKNVLDSTSRSVPFGIGQMGKSFRNEITPGKFIFRVREFEQMELEFFVKPGTDEDWFKYWVQTRIDWWIEQGIKKENLEIVLEKLIKMPSSEIKKIPSLSERRSEIIIPGALILKTSMEMLNFNRLTISERALREGLVVDWMLRQGIIKNEFNIQSNIRKTTIIHQARKFGVDKERSEKVTNIAFQIYDQTKNIFIPTYSMNLKTTL